MRLIMLMIPFLVLFGACGDNALDSKSSDRAQPDTAKEHGHSHDGASHHGSIVGLGSVELGGERFAIARHGACEPGKEGAFVVSRVGGGSHSSLFLWVEDASGEQISAPAQGDPSGVDFHFHVTPRADAGEPVSVILRLRDGSRDERAELAVHGGAAPIHDGVSAPILRGGGATAGWIELKLHDDKGDLELWLARDAAMKQPFDIPLETVISVTFVDHGDRLVELRVRDRETNEGEDGKANVRSGRTNYFIFPGETGVDASWLRGREFRSAVTVNVQTAEGELDSPTFVLVPHGHGAGNHHH